MKFGQLYERILLLIIIELPNEQYDGATEMK